MQTSRRGFGALGSTAGGVANHMYILCDTSDLTLLLRLGLPIHWCLPPAGPARQTVLRLPDQTSGICPNRGGVRYLEFWSTHTRSRAAIALDIDWPDRPGTRRPFGTRQTRSCPGSGGVPCISAR